MPFSIGTVVVNVEHRVAFASTYFCVLLGMRPNEIVGVSFFDFVFPEDIDKAREMFEPPGADTLRLRLRRLDGQAVWVGIKGSPILGPSGETHGITLAIAAAETAQVQ